MNRNLVLNTTCQMTKKELQSKSFQIRPSKDARGWKTEVQARVRKVVSTTCGKRLTVLDA
jgi:hypothetical protein